MNFENYNTDQTIGEKNKSIIINSIKEKKKKRERRTREEEKNQGKEGGEVNVKKIMKKKVSR